MKIHPQHKIYVGNVRRAKLQSCRIETANVLTAAHKQGHYCLSPAVFTLMPFSVFTLQILSNVLVTMTSIPPPTNTSTTCYQD